MYRLQMLGRSLKVSWSCQKNWKTNLVKKVKTKKMVKNVEYRLQMLVMGLKVSWNLSYTYYTNSIQISSKYHTNIIQILYKYYTNTKYRLQMRRLKVSWKLWLLPAHLLSQLADERLGLYNIQILFKYHTHGIQISYKYYTNIIQISYKYHTNII